MATRATSVQITMPQMGESVTEGTVLGWLKQVGDRVEADEPLVEISTDKVDAEVPAPVSGTLVKILAEADETVQVGSVLGEIEPDGDGAAGAARRPQRRPPAGGGRGRRRGLPGDGRLGRRGHRARVAREGGRRRRRRRPAGRDLHRQGRCRGALAGGRHDRGDPRRGRRDGAVGTVLCRIAGPGRSAANGPCSRAPSPTETKPAAGAPAGERRATRRRWPRASPSAHGLDVEAITGSGPRGRVTKEDVLAAVEGNGGAAARPRAAERPADPRPGRHARRSS